MSQPSAVRPGALRRALLLGLIVFGAYLLATGAVWAVGTALGMSRVPAFLVAVCAGPAVVSGALLFWLYLLSPARRQSLLGGGALSDTSEETSPRGGPPTDESGSPPGD